MVFNMSNINNEIVFEGWLTKSPPSKRLWKARWRRRWFVLKHSGELPGQFFLLYYTDKNCRKLKGTIDLDQCEQVDAGLRFENSKQNYPHMFDVRTPKRTYYLAAESENQMNKWVDCVCQVCGLRGTIEDTSVEFMEENTDSLQSEGDSDTRSRRSLRKKSDPTSDRTYTLDLFDENPSHRVHQSSFVDSPPVSPTISVSGPYIPISECHSGKPLNTPKGISDFNNIISRQELTNSKVRSKDCFAQPQQSYKGLTRANNMKQTICDDDISKCDVSKPIALPMPVQAKPPVVERLNSLYGDRNNLKPRREDKITNIESAKKMAEMRREAVSDEFYDSPRKVVADEWQRPVVPVAAPAPNWETFPGQDDADMPRVASDFSPGDIGSWSVVERFGKLTVVDSKLPIVTNSLNRACRQQRRQPDTYSLRRPVAPPRPPKPQHLIIPEQPRGEEASPCSEGQITPSPDELPCSDETYDVPRSHQPQNGSTSATGRQNYTNTKPSETQGNVFRYDFTEIVNPSASGEPISPRSEGSGVLYSNLPSPLVNTPGVPTPPVVNRELKPTRKMSDSGASNEPSPGPYTPSLGPITPTTPVLGPTAANLGPITPTTPLLGPATPTLGPYSAEPSPVGFGPPSIDRTLKPKKPSTEGSIKLARPPDGSLGMRRVRAGPSPTLPHTGAGGSGTRGQRARSEHSSGGEDDQEQIYFYDHNSALYSQMNLPHIQYLDLDLDSEGGVAGPLTTPPATSGPSATPYKTIDFIKTDALNRTREEVEEKLKVRDCPDSF